MKVIITGSTGMVGKGVLLECLDDQAVSEVLVINRSPIGMQHPKLKEIIHKDFADYSKWKTDLSGYDACYYCMGVSAGGMKEEDYRHFTYDFALALARKCYQANPQMTFCYISGEGTDTSENGRMMWARVKGKTENDILALGFKQAFMFRPGIIQPLRGIKSKTPAYQFFYSWLGWIIPVIKAFSKDAVTTTTKLGKTMINVHRNGFDKIYLSNKEINALGG